ncbi:helix-turn-helix domain-containing protein [Proteocatella sphenisci]|uniref:helix-turn-helix domain-containing protein n=1 Tax=Proteocatella sphenisci TaxID=181070 RepID=UPI00048E420E|nr:helix-turn-helix transcriptional regulator [Proteocatella sphenisci]
MTIGDKIKKIRKYRNMTQKQLGILCGFSENTADVRIRQYENNSKIPKEDMLKNIANALNINVCALNESSLYAAEDVMFSLFELDDHYSIPLFKIIDDTDSSFPQERIAISFKYKLINDFLKEWLIRKEELATGVITKEEYFEWKINWPDTCDDCGKFEPSKKWRTNDKSKSK